MGRIFAVTSGKGGVGKSTLSAGLALCFCRLGRRVLLVDMDEGLRCLDLMLGVDGNIVFDLADVLMGTAELGDAVSTVPDFPGLSLIPAPAKCGQIDLFSLTGFAGRAQNEFDITIFDFPAGIDFSLYSALPPDALFLTVSNPDPVSVRDCAAVSAQLESMGLKSRMVINNFNREFIRSGKQHGIDDIIDLSGLQLIGIVPESNELRFFAVNHRLKPRGRAMKALERIAKRLEGEQIPLPRPKKI